MCSLCTPEGEVLAALCFVMLMSTNAEHRVNLPLRGRRRRRRQKGCISHGRSPVVWFSCRRQAAFILAPAERPPSFTIYPALPADWYLLSFPLLTILTEILRLRLRMTAPGGKKASRQRIAVSGKRTALSHYPTAFFTFFTNRSTILPYRSSGWFSAFLTLLSSLVAMRFPVLVSYHSKVTVTWA